MVYHIRITADLINWTLSAERKTISGIIDNSLDPKIWVNGFQYMFLNIKSITQFQDTPEIPAHFYVRTWSGTLFRCMGAANAKTES